MSLNRARRAGILHSTAASLQARQWPQSLTANWFMRIATSLVLAGLLTSTLPAQTPQAVVDRVFSDPRMKTAEQFLRTDHDRIVREIITLTEIPAPPFKEADRARAYMQMLKDHGLSNVEADAEG